MTLNVSVNLSGFWKRDITFKEYKLIIKIIEKCQASAGFEQSYSPEVWFDFAETVVLFGTQRAFCNLEIHIKLDFAGDYMQQHFRPASLHPRKTKLVTMEIAKFKVLPSRCEFERLTGLNKCGLDWEDSVTLSKKLTSYWLRSTAWIRHRGVCVCVCVAPRQVNWQLYQRDICFRSALLLTSLCCPEAGVVFNLK